jgi:hypothetical protein
MSEVVLVLPPICLQGGHREKFTCTSLCNSAHPPVTSSFVGSRICKVSFCDINPVPKHLTLKSHALLVVHDCLFNICVTVSDDWGPSLLSTT